MMTKIVHVAVGVIQNQDGKIFIAKRPDNVHQGGLWEFPGGKVDSGESLQQALARELKEELAIDVLVSTPLIKIRHDYGDKIVLLDVHKVTHFAGEPMGNEGQIVRWVAASELHEFEFPAANRPIITAINLPQYWLITGAAASHDEYLLRTRRALERGIRLVQLRMQNSSSPAFFLLAQEIAKLCVTFSANLQLNTSVANYIVQDNVLNGVGLHLNSVELYSISTRPVSENVFLSASCHNQEDIEQAKKIAVDFICLSPVQATSSHEGVALLGWGNFESLTATATVPVFALGGMSEQDVPQALQAGAHGIAGITAWW